ncbi:MAG TPA: helical backbone metal receptor [Trueperaceae bacterium]|nr:helical backbone metal receptor [Trueperaceae bacterium]
MGEATATRSTWLGGSVPASGMRLVSLVPSLTLAVFELGAGPSLVGRTRFCVEPRPEVDRVPVVGGTKNVHVGEVLALAPDVVLANREENVRERVEAIARRVPVWLSDPRGPEDVPSLWRELGEICGARAAGERRAVAVEAALRRAGESAPDERPGFVYWVWRDPWMAAGHDTYISRLLSAAGWRNALPAGMDRYPRLEPVDALALASDAMLFPDEPYAFSLPGDLDAFGPPVSDAGGVRRVEGVAAVEVDGRAFGWYPSRTVDGLERAAALRERVGRRAAR